MDRRKHDLLLADIRRRLTVLESAVSNFAEVKEWMADVTKVFRFFEMMACFFTKWTVRAGKLAGALGVIWGVFKLGLADPKELLRLIFK